MLRVCIADDHELLVLGMRAALAPSEDIELVGEAHSGERVIELVDTLLPDIVLVSITMPGLDGLTCLRLIKDRHPAVDVVMLSGGEHSGAIGAALEGGASACLSKRVRPVDLASALRQLAAPASPQPIVSDTRPAGHGAPTLTERERTLLHALARGLSTKAISSELWISETTVKFHLTNIYRKLGVHNRTSAVRYAYEHSLISPEYAGAGS